MTAVYRTGMQFQGDVDIPIIDWRHYLEDDLDMHHRTRASPPASGCSTTTATPATR